MILTSANPAPTAGLTNSDPIIRYARDTVIFTACGVLHTNSSSTVNGSGPGVAYPTAFFLVNGDKVFAEVTSARM